MRLVRWDSAAPAKSVLPKWTALGLKSVSSMYAQASKPGTDADCSLAMIRNCYAQHCSATSRKHMLRYLSSSLLGQQMELAKTIKAEPQASISWGLQVSGG